MARARDKAIEKAREDALVWFTRLNSGDADQTEISAHATWMAASEINAQEYAALDNVWADLDRMGDPRRKVEERAPVGMSRRAFITGSAVAASAVGYVAIAGLPDFLTSDYATGTGMLSEARLPDGTQVVLDADTAIALDYGATQRGVRLLRGRALFTVAHDVTRPFFVEASGGRVAALGTKFMVHEWAGEVTVAVEESRVSVTAYNGRTTELGHGQQISYGRAHLSEIAVSDPDAATAWQRGKLVFEDRPLRQVIADINRYRHGTIRIADRRLQDLRVSGAFTTDDPDSVLNLVEDTLPVWSVHLTPLLVILRHA